MDWEDEDFDEEKEAKALKLSDTEYEKLITDLEEFDFKLFKDLAGTEQFEIVDTSQDGQYMTRDQYTQLRSEATKLGIKLLYKISISSTKYLVINPKTLKSIIITEGIH